jgi:flagellar basal-body rod modification protein FlgD
MNYMKLLVAQLQNQDPLEPMDNNQMASQLAQLTQLEQIESLNSNFAKVLSTTQLDYATSLIGKTVSYYGQGITGEVELLEGIVQEVARDAGGEICLNVGGMAVALEDVSFVKN